MSAFAKKITEKVPQLIASGGVYGSIVAIVEISHWRAMLGSLRMYGKLIKVDGKFMVIVAEEQGLTRLKKKLIYASTLPTVPVMVKS